MEEQFYIVYPTLFLIVAHLAGRISFRRCLAGVLVAIVVASYAYSIVFTSSNAASAFFSPLTRAWELALGALITVAGTGLRRVPRSWAAIMSWVGLAAIVTASLTLTSSTVYPGALVAIPVVGAGLVIAGGAAEPSWGAERLFTVAALPTSGSHLLFALSVALADPHHRHATPRRDHLARLGQRGTTAHRRRGGDRHLSAGREPDPALEVLDRTAIREHRPGGVSCRCHRPSRDLRDTPTDADAGHSRNRYPLHG